MKLQTLVAFAVLLIAASCSAGNSGFDSDSTTAPQGSSSTNSDTANGRYVVVLNPTTGKGTSAVSRVTSSLATAPDQVYDAVFSGFAGQLSSAEVQRLKADPQVASVEPDIKLHAQIQAVGWGVNRIDADLNSRWIAGTGGQGVGVAVLDTGIQTTHPDLVGAVVASVDETGSGTVQDQNGHGTHVAGIIGARKNTLGYVGVAPDCNLINIKVMDSNGSGYLSWIIAGLNWAASHKSTYNIKVANMSLGVEGSSSALATAVTSAYTAGIVLVAAAGNDHLNASGFIPGAYSNVVCVSAMTSSNYFASYSNYGSVVDFIAPGSSIPSLWKGSGYATASGTSMASPHVAGAFALWFDSHTGAPADAITAVKAAGESGTWPGDPDGIHEKLIDAQNL